MMATELELYKIFLILSIELVLIFNKFMSCLPVWRSDVHIRPPSGKFRVSVQVDTYW